MRIIIKRRRSMVMLLIGIGIIALGWLWYEYWLFPYGKSHSCDKGLMFALLQYAEEHNGNFPAGKKSPEASLSLLYPNYTDASVLQGKTIPLDTVIKILEGGNLLGPETCGWHYVEGLRNDDNPRLALVWDKVGLGHFGERLFRGGHEVLFVNMDSRYIPGDEWDAFLKEQEELIQERNKKKEIVKPKN